MGIALLPILLFGCLASSSPNRVALQVAPFSCDVTPPIGHPLCGGWIEPLSAVDDQLLAKGIMVSSGRTRYVMCAIDWCLLQTTAYDLFRRKLAAAADVPEAQVSVHTVHQHNAPIADIRAQLLLNGEQSAPPHLDLRFMEEVTNRVAAAVRTARQELRPDDFIAVAAYGESGPGYICCDAALKEGGYEPTMSRVGPPSEFRLKSAIAALLEPRPPQASPPFYPDKLRLLVWRDEMGVEHPIEKASDWPKRRAHILAGMEQVMGPRPAEGNRTPPDLRILEEVRLPAYTRQKITFGAEAGDRVPAYLLIPHDLKGPAPAMLCLHQTTPLGKGEPAGLGGKTNLHYAHELAGRGYVTLAPDYPTFGDYAIDVYGRGYASATMKGIRNHLRAVDLLSSLPQVDRQRLGVIGHSLGGHNALFVAAFDPRLKAVVTSCGFNSFFKYQGGDLTGWSHAGYMPRIASIYSRDPKLMPFDFTEVLAALAPRAVFVNAPMGDTNFEVSGVKDCVLAASPVYALLGAGDRLTVRHPDCGHDFPPEVRSEAYAWLERWLR
jgi:dienelactone hydrolase